MREISKTVPPKFIFGFGGKESHVWSTTKNQHGCWLLLLFCGVTNFNFKVHTFSVSLLWRLLLISQAFSFVVTLFSLFLYRFGPVFGSDLAPLPCNLDGKFGDSTFCHSLLSNGQ